MRTALFVLLCVCLGCVSALQKKKAPFIKEDVKQIKCLVCQRFVKQIHSETIARRAANPKLKEIDIIQLVENACDPEAEEGEWISQHDIVGEQSVQLIEHRVIGHCDEECQSIAKACDDIIGNGDTDVAEWLWNGISQSNLEDKVCRKITTSCVKLPPPLQKNRRDYPFREKTAKEIEVDRTLRGMRDNPAMQGAEVYSRDEYLERMQHEMEDVGGEEMMEEFSRYMEKAKEEAAKQSEQQQSSKTDTHTKQSRDTDTDTPHTQSQSVTHRLWGYAQSAVASVKRLFTSVSGQSEL